ncbi:MAG: SusC/RagA family TonB-linked outer membrane protein, partial [Daejeonella sp.]
SQTTSTDAQGNYSFPNVAPGTYTLVFTYLGFTRTTREVTLREGQQSVIEVSLAEESGSLDEVVVIGYGTQKRSDLTGAVSSVKASELQQTPITSIDQGLVGRSSGVMVTQTSGMPGAIASIRIRGSSSLQGGNEPLYVIDGVPVYSGGGFGDTGGGTKMSPLATINSNDIESIEILKDASATAIYGSRAANGVILITTKKGKGGRDVLTFDSYYGTQSVVKKIDLMDATSYAALVNEAYTNDGLVAPYSAEAIKNIPNGGMGTNWQDEVFRTAPMQNHQLSFSGGDEKSTYAASLNYLNQQGVIINSDLKRYSGRINFNRRMGERFRLASNLSMSRNLSNSVVTDAGGEGGVVTGALKFNPILPVYENRELGIYNKVNRPGGLYPNPVATALELKRRNNTTRLLGNFSGELDILKDLKAKVLFGFDYFMNKVNRYTPSSVYQSGGVASASISDQMYTNWLNENTLTYTKTINQDHAITLLGGATFQRNRAEELSASSQGFVNDVLQDNSLGSGSVYNRPGSGATEWGILSFLGRANYNFKNRYLFTASGRYDGSSRFGENNKFAFFPSAAFAWKAGEEDFIKKSGLFSTLKTRISYGVTGNQEIGLYSSLPTLSSASYTIGPGLVTGFFPNGIPNPDLRWEKTAQYDAGLDAGFFNNRVTVTADYYYKKTTDLIYSVSIPYVSGFGTSLQNIGSVANKGVELALETTNLDRGLKWNTSFNISFNKNKVLELGGEQYKDVGSGDGHLKTGAVHRLILGEPIGVFYGYVFDGIFQNPAELAAGPKGATNYVGGKRYKDLGGPAGVPDGKVDATYDRMIVGDPNPDFFGGLTNNFSYKGVELNVFMLYSQGNGIFNYNAIESTLPTGGQNVYAALKNRWTPQNPSNVYARATTNRSAIFSNQFIEDGSYVKLKSLTLSYLFPSLKSKSLSALKVYATGQNLLTFTNYKGYDPEVSFRGASNLQSGEDYGGYPQARTFLLGLSMSLR